jgi:2-hydroxy-6-oxonona-2,4-dienedioate hydrolase
LAVDFWCEAIISDVARLDRDPLRRWRPTRRQMLIGAGAMVIAGGGYAHNRFSHAIRAAERRIAGRSSVITTDFGMMEYAVSGAGSPLMMVHGTGGGFDQGLRFAAAIAARGHRIIAPSRFGYLRSDFPNDASSEAQADAFIALLDHLGLARVPVAGGSAGALSATQFALHHPDRCSGLILLVPAANVHGRDPVEMSSIQKTLVEGLVESDLLYWALLNTAPRTLIGTLLATDPNLLDVVSVAERNRAYAILNDMLPIHLRSRGMLNDGRLAGSPARINFHDVQTPTLIISAEDDRFGTADTARVLAATIPRAQLTVYPTGGHIWLGHDSDVADRIDQFLRVLI